MDLSVYLLVIVASLLLLWCYGTYIGNHFLRHGVKSLPSWPFFGHLAGTLFQREHVKELIHRTYKAFPNERYVGVYQFMNRMILVPDLELIKQLAIKDFDHFTDHFGTVDESVDPLFGCNLFALKGQKWRDMRSTLSPAFTSSKMRNMFELVAECAEKMAGFYMKELGKPENSDKTMIEVEMKEAFTRYTNDVIATVAFGISVDSHSERDNYFYKTGKEFSNFFSGIKLVKFFFIITSPWLSKVLNIKLFSDKLCNYYRDLVNNTMKAREEGNISRPDMIHLLMEAKKGSLKHEQESGVNIPDAKEAGFATVEESSVGKSTVKRKWSDDDIIAQTILFFIAGFDTSSTLLSFLAYELAVNPDIQEKLQKEIDEIALNNDGKVNYNDLQNMKYLDMVVCETLRYWPPGITTDRKCIKPYTFPPPRDGSDQKGYNMKVGEGIWLPIWGIHHDPKYYSNPEKFDPERFSDENKGSIQPFTYLPFGIGPRNCIGSRFALMETKAVVFHLLAKFDFTVISKTQIPLKLAKNTFNLYSEQGIWIGLQPRISRDKK